MKPLTFWFDPISPFAHLAFARLPEALMGLSYSVSYRPILFAGLLKVWGQKGPAEIEPKRAWTFRHVAWLADRHGVTLDVPAQHPFNPLALSRLMWACAPEGGTPNRQVCERVLRHAWHGGLDANEPTRLSALRASLNPQRDPDGDPVKPCATAFSGCRRSRSMAACSGASTPSTCSPRICAATRGSRAAPGRPQRFPVPA
jgi:DSBA-like thioredoxin domain